MKILVGLLIAGVLVLLALQFKGCNKNPDPAPPVTSECDSAAGQKWSKADGACICKSKKDMKMQDGECVCKSLRKMNDDGDCVCDTDVAIAAADGSCKAKVAEKPCPDCEEEKCPPGAKYFTAADLVGTNLLPGCHCVSPLWWDGDKCRKWEGKKKEEKKEEPKGDPITLESNLIDCGGGVKADPEKGESCATITESVVVLKTGKVTESYIEVTGNLNGQ